MTLPTYINILSTEYSLFAYDKQIPGTEDDWGLCDKDKRIISIRWNRDPVANVDTLIHEILHAIWYEYQMCEEGEEEEICVGKLASGLAKVMKRNPVLLDWIKEQLHA